MDRRKDVDISAVVGGGLPAPDAPPRPRFDMPAVGEARAAVTGDAAFATPAAPVEATPEPVARSTGAHGTLAPPVVAKGGVARRVDAAPDGVRALVRGGVVGVGGVVAWLVAVVAAVLPLPWRRRLDSMALPWTSAVVASGVLEVIVASVVWSRAFMSYHEARVGEAGAVAADVMNRGVGDAGDAYRVAQIGGFAIFLMFLFTPAALACGFFIVEGVLRAVGGAVQSEVRGSLPLWLLERVVARVTSRIAAARRVPGVPDEFTRIEVDPGPGGTGGLRVASCREKDWDNITTIEFEGRRYRLASLAVEGPGSARRFVYNLRSAAEHEIVRRVLRYDPGEDRG